MHLDAYTIKSLQWLAACLCVLEFLYTTSRIAVVLSRMESALSDKRRMMGKGWSVVRGRILTPIYGLIGFLGSFVSMFVFLALAWSDCSDVKMTVGD